MPQTKDPTLTSGTILGLFFIQRYRFLTVDQFARAAGLKRSTAASQLRLLGAVSKSRPPLCRAVVDLPHIQIQNGHCHI